ncbi:MAG TPA: hypothetical protein ENJ06_04930 [Phycisphaeraceae bacterium]|nr:hypothetical protein [Phycisphaeraceae bacterium]
MRNWLQEFSRTRHRILIEDALKHIYACEVENLPATMESLAGALHIHRKKAVRLCTEMQKQHLVKWVGGAMQLSDTGRELTLQIIRAHRLWERYLADEAGMSLLDIHAEADRREHHRLPARMEALEAQMGHPVVDPHGDPIPRADGSVSTQDRTSLTDWPMGQDARVIHIEDEPRQAMAEILRTGLKPGSILVPLEKTASTLRFRVHGREQDLPLNIAANIHVTSPSFEEKEKSTSPTLDDLPLHYRAIVKKIDSSCRGFTRRRLLDLGITPGTEIEAELATGGGSARAYRVRDTLIALRREQAKMILLHADSLQPADRGAVA